MSVGCRWLNKAERDASLQYARSWRERNRAKFDQMDREGMFADSVPRLSGAILHGN